VGAWRSWWFCVEGKKKERTFDAKRGRQGFVSTALQGKGGRTSQGGGGEKGGSLSLMFLGKNRRVN